MSARYVQDMTKGNEVSIIIKFALPMLIGNIFQQLYTIINSIIVGKYIGVGALAAVGATASLNYLFFSVCFGLSIGAGVIISQYFGANKDEEVKVAIVNSNYVIIGAGIIMSLLAIVFARPVLRMIKTPEEILEDATLYMVIVSAGMIAVAAYNSISASLRALGDSRTPIIFLMFSGVINVILDLVFILQFKFGVAGTAAATVISQGCAALACIVFALWKNPYFKLKKEHWKLNRSIIVKCIKIGIPIAAQNAMIALSLVALQRVVNSFGEVAVAAFTATSRVEMIIQQPFNSLGAAMATFVGQNIGAGKLDRVKKGYYKCIGIVAISSLIFLIVAQFGGYAIMEVFIKKEDMAVIDLGAKSLRITSCMYFFLGMIYLTRGLLNGAGDAFYSMINGIVEVAGRVGFSVILTLIPFFGVWSVWITTGLTWFVVALATVLRYIQGKWKYKSLVVSQ